MISLLRGLIVFAASGHALAETMIRRAAAGKTEDGNGGSGGDWAGRFGGRSQSFLFATFLKALHSARLHPPPAAGLRARLHGGNSLQPPPRLAKQAAPARRMLVFALAAQRVAVFPIFRGGRLLWMFSNPRCQVLLFRWLLKCSRELSVRPKNSTFA